jgi:carboxymethylenebutenolidase
VAGAAAAGYALAAGPVSARAIQTGSEGLVAGEVRLDAAGTEITAYRAHPAAGDPAPVVIVVHEIFGVHEYIRDVCRRLAREGYFAVAPDLYQRQGDVSRLDSIDEVIEKVVKRVPDAQVMADLDATLAWAGGIEAADASRAAITGFCWGGRVVWLYAATSPDIRAGAAWYGRLVGAERAETPKHPIDLVGSLRAPVLGLYGARDGGIPLENVDAMRARIAEAEQSSEIIVFPGAPHGFHADYRSSYRELAAAEGWRRMLEWFRANGVR